MGITPVKPEQACPLQGHFFSAETTLVSSLIAATWMVTLPTKPFGATRAAFCKTATFVNLGFTLQTTCEGLTQLPSLFRNSLQENSSFKVRTGNVLGS